MNKNNKRTQILKINLKLPQIILPENKIQMFLDWYNQDLRFQNTVPQAFKEGYLFIKNNFLNIKIEDCKDYIKLLARNLNTTYRYVEDKLKNYLGSTHEVIIHFYFIDNNVNLDVYDKYKIPISKMHFGIGEGESKQFTNYYLNNLEQDWDNTLNKFNEYCVILFCTCMWYISTTTKTTKYYYEQKNKPIPHKNKRVVNVAKNKVINTPIYDMNKIRRIKVDNLIKRRKGWTYSHAFQVHGHYRHYKDGKVIFVNSYIKGKNKELKPQVITLNPKEDK